MSGLPAALVRGRDLLLRGAYDDAERELLQVERTGPFYSAACVLLATSAHARGKIPFRVDHYLADFLRAAPTLDDERRAFEALEGLYRAQGLLDHADDLRTLLYGDATLPEQPGALPSLPSLPSLPPAAPLPSLAPAEEPKTAVTPPPRGSAFEDDATDVFTLTPRPAAVPATPPLAPKLAPRQEPPAPSRVDAGRGRFAVGALVSNRYRIEGEVGAGGMATVYRATDTELDEQVALKVFHAGHLGPEQLERFKQELRVARRLRHKNVVQLFDLGVEKGDYFITMELLRGRDLHDVIRGRKDPMPSGHAVRLLVEACAGVEAAHAMGVIHRDIKPSNFFVTDEGALKVMDFGIAKATTVDDGGLKTRAGSVLGTPQYMSPEQASDSAQVTAATDIYALGVVAFELLTRTRPFDGGGIVNILLAHVNKPPPEPRSRNPAIPPGLEAVVLRCLEKRPEDRYASCRALAAALAPFQSEG